VDEQISTGLTPVRAPRPRPRAAVLLLALIGVLSLAAIAVSFVLINRPKTQAVRSSAAPPQTLIGSELGGMVAEVLVKEGQTVTEGQVLLVIDSRPYREAVDAAQASLDQITKESAKTGIAVTLPPVPDEVPHGTIRQTAPLHPPAPPAGTSPLPKVSGNGGTAAVAEEPPTREAEDPSKQLQEAEATIKRSKEALAKQDQEIAAATTALENAEAAVEPARQAVRHAEVIQVRAKQQHDRIQPLLSQGAVSVRDVNTAHADLMRANANLDSAKSDHQSAVQAVARHEEALKNAKEAKSRAEKDLKVAQSKVADLRKRVATAKKPAAAPTPAPVATLPPPASPGPRVQKPAYVEVRKPNNESVAPAPVEVDFTAKAKADEKVIKATQVLEEAKAKLAKTQIVAPKSGVVVRIFVRPGEVIAEGKTLFTIR
jgi:multidrug resistance efflux pump